MTNTQQFNFNLPKQRFQTCYRLNDARYGSYENTYSAFEGIAPPAAAQLGNDDFYTWEKSYPYQCVEGCLVNLKVNNNLSIGYEYQTLPIPEANVNYNLYLPSLSTGSKRTFLPNEKRFYIGKQKFTGPHYIAKENVVAPDGAVPPNTYSYVLDEPWDYLTQSVEFKVDEGFITPSSLAAQLTEQLHTREGTADNFKCVNVEPVTFEIGNKLTTSRFDNHSCKTTNPTFHKISFLRIINLTTKSFSRCSNNHRSHADSTTSIHTH